VELHYLSPNPFEQFHHWFKEAEVKSAMKFPNSMSLATVDATGRPSVRIVLLKGASENGFVFFSNYESRKGAELEFNPQASLCFFWDSLGRQVRIEGLVEKISTKESEEYFHSRPRESQIGAWASKQSRPIESRKKLEEEFQRLSKEFYGKEIPMPEFWGGYRMVPEKLEFWQLGEHRLHDRFVYFREGEKWKIERLSP
jgi:pyridoxamine 5'-phosphate oxidase